MDSAANRGEPPSPPSDSNDGPCPCPSKKRAMLGLAGLLLVCGAVVLGTALTLRSKKDGDSSDAVAMPAPPTSSPVGAGVLGGPPPDDGAAVVDPETGEEALSDPTRAPTPFALEDVPGESKSSSPSISANDFPRVRDDSDNTVQENRSILIDVIANDEPADGRPMFVSEIVDAAQNGYCRIDSSQDFPTRILYTPRQGNPGYFGIDTCTYKACDAENKCSQEKALVTITIEAKQSDYCLDEPDMDCYLLGRPWCCNDSTCTEETDMSCETWPGCGDELRGVMQTFQTEDFYTNPTCLNWFGLWFGDDFGSPDFDRLKLLYQYDSSPSCDGFKATANELGTFSGCVVDVPVADFLDCTIKTADPMNVWNLVRAWPGLEGCSIKSELPQDAVGVRRLA